MTRFGYMMRELGRSLYRNPGTVLALLLSLTLLLLLFDLFWVAAGTSDKFYRDLVSELEVEVFLNEDVPDSLAADLQEKLVSVDGIISARYISRDSARVRLADLVGMDLLVGYEETNPLPRSYVLLIQPSHLNSSSLAEIEKQLLALNGVSEVLYSREWLHKAEETHSVIIEIGLALGILILAAVLVGSTNSIRLVTGARAIGLRQMLLLGAGRMFISLPFVMEGFLIAGLSAGLGWLIMFYGRTRIQFSQFDIVFPTTQEVVYFCLLAALLGALSGLVGVRRALRE